MYTFYAIFAIYADEHFDNCYFFRNLLQRMFFRKTQISMTLSIPDNAKVNAKRYLEHCCSD